MMKNISVATLLLLIAIVGAAQSTCDPDKPTYYAAAETNIYQSANVNSAIITKVPWKSSVRVISSDGIMNPDMWVICHKGKEGYALRRLLSYDKITAEQPQTRTEVPDTRAPISERISNLFKSSGSGSVEGGLENRGGAGPAIEDRSQEQGKVVIRVCVNSSGKVISADFAQRGSTTKSRSLIRLAKENAMQYTFKSSSVDKQCGTIAYDFRVGYSDAFGSGSNDELYSGPISRVRISSPPISDLMQKVGRVVVKTCVNRRGQVVYAEYDSENSTISDIGHKRRAIEHVQKIIFERNNGAPDKECGYLTFRMTPNGFEQE